MAVAARARGGGPCLRWRPVLAVAASRRAGRDGREEAWPRCRHTRVTSYAKAGCASEAPVRGGAHTHLRGGDECVNVRALCIFGRALPRGDVGAVAEDQLEEGVQQQRALRADGSGLERH
eukprot:5102116-Prymnesium_polylepis.1